VQSLAWVLGRSRLIFINNDLHILITKLCLVPSHALTYKTYKTNMFQQVWW